MKPKKGNTNGMQSSPIKICDKFKTKNSAIQSTIEKLRTECYIEEQQKLLKLLPEHLVNPDDSEFVTALLTYLFLTIDTKHPLRKTISRILLTASNDLIKKTLSGNILYLLDSTKNENDCVYRKQYEVIINLQNCFNNFPPGIEAISSITDNVTPYAIDFFTNLVDLLGEDKKIQLKKTDVHTYIYNVTKLLVSLLQQCSLSQTLPDNSTKLMIAAYKVIMDDYISFDTKCNCGLLMVVSVIHIPDHISNDLKFKANPCLSLLKFDKPEDESQGFFNFKELTKNYTANLCVYSGILNVVPQNILCEEIIDGVPVISFMFGKLLECAKKCTGKPTQILEVSRALILISKIMNTIPLSYVEPMFSQGLDYVWTHLDHFVDTVKHSAKTIFENLIKLAYRHYKDGHTQLLKMILTNMIDLLVNRCTHYIALTILSAETGCSFLLEQFSHLPFILLINIADSSVAPQICNTYESLMAQHAKEEQDVNKWLELWVDLIKPLLSRSSAPATTFYQRLLISAYKIQPLVLKSIKHYRKHSGANELGALLGCLRVTRKSGLPVRLGNNKEIPSTENIMKYWRGFIQFDFLELMMCHQSDEVRISVLALIVESQKSTEIFTSWELKFLKKYFHYNVTTQMPNTRQQMIALYKKALIRIKEGLAVLIRQGTIICNKVKADGDETKKGVVEELQLYKKQEVSYKVFIETFFHDYLCPGFHYGSNYQRRATCLELTLFMITEKCVEMEELERNWKSIDTISLLGALGDTYESNISLAFQLIKKLPPHFFEQSKELVRTNILRTIALASAIKPTSATAAGYIIPVHLMSPYAREVILNIMQHSESFENTYVLTISLFIHLMEAGMELAKKDIIEAVRKTPVYGYILGIRHLIDKGDLQDCNHWEYLVTKLVAISKEVSQVASPIVNNSSPEGYLPEGCSQSIEDYFPMDSETNKKDSSETVTSQMVLVYAWRTTKEISLLLGELALRAPDTDPKTGKELFTDEIMSSISEHFLNLFLETKHRGAYEQAYLGFCKFCEKLWRSPNEEFRSWPKTWLLNILTVLRGDNENTFDKLCPTRRSAGLPFMIQAIVITEPKDTGSESFHLCMRTLLNIAADPSDDNIKSRIHSMNILRSLYRNNHLGELVAQYIAQGVITALNAFDHDIWGVRNAATLLFATLVIRMFGVQRTRDMDEISLKNRMSARVFFMRYPELYDFLLQQLMKGTANTEDTTSLHPVLLILERLYPCNTEEENQLGKYLPYVTKCLSNPTYKIRELAAQASTSIIPNFEVVEYIKNILITLSDVTLSDNYCQGLIMQLMYLLRSLNKGYTPLNVPELIEPTFWIFLSIGKYTSHYTVALYFNMLVSLSSVFLKNCQGAWIFAKLVEILLWQSVKESGRQKLLSTAKKKYHLARFNLHMHIMSNLYHCDSYFKSLYIKELILSGLYSVHEEINQFSLNYINYLYFQHPKYEKHSLYLTEQLEIGEKEYKLVTTLDTSLKEYVIESIHKDLERKLFPVFYDLLGKSKECCLCVFLMLQHYPCVVNNIKPYKQEILDFLMEWCRTDDDEMFCAVLSVISTFLNSLSECEVRELSYCALLKVIVDGSSPNSSLHQRVSVAQFLVANKWLFCQKDYFINVQDLSDLWTVVIVLLEDDDQLVRNTISLLSNTEVKLPSRSDIELPPVIAEKAREDLMQLCVDVLPTKVTIPLLLSWALRRASEEEDSPEPFDRGESNIYAEKEQVAKLATTHLKDLLWKLEDGLNYDDLSIFVEEHTLLVATVIYNTLYQTLPSVVNTNVRIALLCIIKKLLDYLEKCPINKPDFEEELEKLIVKEFVNMCSRGTHGNVSRLKYILKCIFSIEHGWPQMYLC